MAWWAYPAEANADMLHGLGCDAIGHVHNRVGIAYLAEHRAGQWQDTCANAAGHRGAID